MPENSRHALLNGSAHKATLDTALRMAVFTGARGDRSIMVTEETVAWGLVNLGLAAPTPCKFPFPRGIPRKGVNASATTAHVSKTTSFMDISNNLDDQRLAAHNLEQEGQARQGQFEINGLAPVHQRFVVEVFEWQPTSTISDDHSTAAAVSAAAAASHAARNVLCTRGRGLSGGSRATRHSSSTAKYPSSNGPWSE